MKTKPGTFSFAALVVAAALALPVAGSASPAKATQLNASMTSRQVVTPKNKAWKVPAAAAKAKGSFVATLSGRKLSWRITYSGLGRPSTVIADVHIGKPGRFGAVLVRLCTACKAKQTGVKTLDASDAEQMKLGNTWVTLITPRYPNGVVRGQIKVR